MASLSLPPPRKFATATHHHLAHSTGETAIVAVSKEGEENRFSDATLPGAMMPGSKRQTRAPTYAQRCDAAAELAKMTSEQRRKNPRKLFVPRALEDFDDGGAFPEIHVAQYPRHMGNPHIKKRGAANSAGTQPTSKAIVNVEVDRDGEISYDMIVKSGTNSGKKVFSRHEDLKGGPPDEEDIKLPDEDEEKKTTERTQAALQKLLASKTALNKPSGSAMVNAETSKNIEEKTQFVKYTPRSDAPGYNPAAAQRVIQMVPAQVDPMMPPKHKHEKAPRGPAEDPVPVLHAPPEKLSKEERRKWNIPACISNWKNTRGYTIPLDKRLAADGRGLREHTINPNFATLSESLYVAERHARQEVRMRAQVQKKLAMQEKDQREEELRQLASQARLERTGAMPSAGADDSHHEEDERKVDLDETRVSDASDDGSHVEGSARDETDEQVAARQREKLRMERKRERERELRIENNMELKKKKLEEERDVSEKIALGVHTGSGGLGAGQVDARLYNQSAGMDSGFGADDEYNTYSAPLFDRQGVSSASIYRPSRGETEYNADESYDKLVDGATSKFQPAKGFSGAEGGGELRAGPRTAPVQFEKGKT